MIKIFAKDYSDAVSKLCQMLQKQCAHFEVTLSQSYTRLAANADTSFEALIFVGNTWQLCQAFAEGNGLALVYDKYAEKKVADFCRLANLPMPAQYVLDKCCSLPESFIHFAACNNFQCACGGTISKCSVFIFPDEQTECEFLFDNYVKPKLFARNAEATQRTIRVFGVTQEELDKATTPLCGKLVQAKTQCASLDGKIILNFAPNCAPKIVENTLSKLRAAFGDKIYSEEDCSLAEMVISELSSRKCTMATAESITGGLIASTIVGVAGASSVLHEGAVTYSVEAKCARLGLNPHFVDEYGVVSPQVAAEMASAQLKNADFSLSTTGYAGPTTDNGAPVGLCYIAVGSRQIGKVKTFRKIFEGSRNEIRAQACNTALFLLLKAVRNQTFFENKQ